MGGVELRFLRIVSTVLVHKVAENGSTETETKPHYGSQEQGNTDGVGNTYFHHPLQGEIWKSFEETPGFSLVGHHEII